MNNIQNLLKKSLALIMAAVMLLAAVPFASYVGLDLNITASAANARLIKSGNCGDKGGNVKYKLYDNGLLEISGKGDMEYYYPDETPYASYVLGKDKYGNDIYVDNTIKKIVIKSGVTSLGNFYSLIKLKEIVIPGTVSYIPYGLLHGCTALTKVTLGNGVKYIEDDAFYDCSSLVSITLPDSVTEIYDNAFYGCTRLANIKMSKNVKKIGTDVFNYTKYYKTSSNWKNGVLYIGKALVATKPQNIPETYKIAAGTRVIASNAFEKCSLLKKVVIPSSILTIGYMAFSECENLEKITIPDSVKSIEREAFSNTSFFNNKKNWENGLLYIGKNLIIAKESTSGKCTIKADTALIADACFSYSDITSIDIPKTITRIPEFTFYGCEKLKNVLLPSTLKRIGLFAFSGCSSLEKISLPSSLREIDGCAFSRSGIKTLTIPEGITEIGDGVLGTEYTKHNKNYTIKGYKNTTAEEYAKESGYKFVSLGTHKHSLKTTKLTKATLTKNGQLVRTCTGCRKTFQTTVRKVSTVKLSKTAYTYTGKVITPSVIVKDSSGKTLKKDQDYTVKYAEGRKKPGTYRVKITLKGNYSGSKTMNFKITAKK